MNWPVARDWWELKSRAELEAQAQRETPRMSNSKIGQWQAINAELDSIRRTRRRPREWWEDE